MGTNMPNITIYSTPSCPYCKMAKEYLAGKQFTYADIDVAADSAKADEMIKKSGQMGVPVIDIDGTIIVGFDKPKINAALGIT
ncbi:glutaredoxin family protein [Candidatus Uhrbacteria bacterium]|nr:glutaredoxin family protein [Candidatus Uhrbacteria bacterium]